MKTPKKSIGGIAGYPVRFGGRLNWAFLKGEEQAEITRAIIRSENEIVVEFTTDGYIYNARLMRQSGNSFAGNYSWRGGGESGKGFASADYYHSEKTALLLGKWIENDQEMFWWVEMQQVDEFKDK